jgi:hypothetical protein
MALVFKDRAMEVATSTGTGTITLAGAVSGYQALSAVGDGSLVDYTIEAVDSNGIPTGAWEVGQGTYTLSGTTLSRTTIYASSNGGSAVSFAAGTKRVFCTLPENRVTQIDYLDTNQTIASVKTFAPPARTSGSAPWWAAQTPADTTLTAGTEAIGMQFGGDGSQAQVQRQWSTGALSTQREFVFIAPKYKAVGASVFTNVATVAITGAPFADTNVTETNPYAFWVQAGKAQFDGQLQTAAGSVGSPAVSIGAANCGFYTSFGSALYAVTQGVSTVSLTQATINAGYGIQIRASDGFGWGAIASAADTWLLRPAAKVIAANGWVQQAGGRARVIADQTENAGTLKSMGLTTDGTNPISLIAGRKYTGRMVVKCVNSTATEGIQFDFNGGSATMTSFWAGAGILASGGTDVIGTNISTSLAGVINFTTFTGESVVIFEISLVCNAAGTFIPRFAENTSAIGTATVRLGSWLWMEDMPA